MEPVTTYQNSVSKKPVHLPLSPCQDLLSCKDFLRWQLPHTLIFSTGEHYFYFFRLYSGKGSAQKSIGCSFLKSHGLKRLQGVRAQSSRAFAHESTPLGPKRICKKVFQVLSLSLSVCSGDCIKTSMGICIFSFLMSDHKITGYLFTCHHHNKTLA